MSLCFTLRPGLTRTPKHLSTSSSCSVSGSDITCSTVRQTCFLTFVRNLKHVLSFGTALNPPYKLQ